MKKGYFSVGAVVLLSLGLFTSQVLAQDFCNASHSGTSVKETVNKTGTIGNVGYELWGEQGDQSATFYSDGSMYCEFNGNKDYLCRSGMSYDCTQTYDQLGHLYADFSVKISGTSNINYSYIGIYGWTRDPLIEWYIVDSWGSQYRPGDWVGEQKIGRMTIDGAEYDVYKNHRRAFSIDGDDKDFDQFFSIRVNQRNCGTIDITAHFDAWASKGLQLGKMYEAKILGEAGNNDGPNATGKFDFNYAKVYVDNSGTPKSSASTNPTSSASTPTSSASNKQATANLPGTIQMESFETNGGDEVTIYGDVVGEVKPNAYLEWTVDVANAGIYNFEVLAARADDQERKSQISLLVDGETVGSVSVLTDTSWNDLHYKAFGGTTSTSIPSGVHTLRVLFNDGYVNVDNIKFAVDGNSQNTPPTSSASVPASSGSITPTSNGSEDNQEPEAIGNIRISQFGMELQVFDMQGRNLGRVSVAAGASLEEILFAKFRRFGVYLVKQGNQLTKVRVTR